MRNWNLHTHSSHSAPVRCLLAATLCAGLLVTGCGSAVSKTAGTEEAAAEAGSTAAAEETAAAASAEKAAAASTEDAAAASTEKAAAASTEDAAAAATEEAVDAGDTAAVSASEHAAETEAGASEAASFSAEGLDLVIVLDPGHSSAVSGIQEPIGPGASETKEADTLGTYGNASGLHEYELTMQVCQKLRAELEHRGYTVRLTHLNTAAAISCAERAAVANENNADAFIRIHANGSEDTSAHGAMTICITEDNPFHPELYSASRRLSEVLLDSYCQQTGAKREKVWETDTMTGNNWSEVPATLLELGYMTNPDEDLQMAMDSYQKKMVASIADGLDRWFAEMPPEELETHPSLSGQSQGDGAEDAGEGSTADASETAEDTDAGETAQDTGAGETAEDTGAGVPAQDTGAGVPAQAAEDAVSVSE